jgi:hypothetical protein
MALDWNVTDRYQWRYPSVTLLAPNVNAGAGRTPCPAFGRQKPKGSAMSLRHGPTLDDLLADSLIQTVMRADHVEPEALKALLNGAARRIAAGRASQRPNAVFVPSGSDRRTASCAARSPIGVRRSRRVHDGDCGTALCC